MINIGQLKNLISLEGGRPEYLYHCNPYAKVGKLRAATKLGVDKTSWDNGLTNEYVYATHDKEIAILMGWASYLEGLGCQRFKIVGDVIEVYGLPGDPKLKDLHTTLSLYQIDYALTNKLWERVDGGNGLDSEYRTSKDVDSKYFYYFSISTRDVLSKYKVIFYT